MGFQVALFSSAEEFLAHRSEAHLSLLLLDGHLPGMSGPELFNHLADIGDELPIVLISSDAPSVESACHPSGKFARVVRKPLDAQVLELVLFPDGRRLKVLRTQGGRMLMLV
jgi:FixJ family two-component response regulator